MRIIYLNINNKYREKKVKLLNIKKAFLKSNKIKIIRVKIKINFNFNYFRKLNES